MAKVFIVRQMVRFADDHVVVRDVKAFDSEATADAFGKSKSMQLQRSASARMECGGTGLDFLASLGIAEIQYGLAEAPIEGLVVVPPPSSIIVPD